MPSFPPGKAVPALFAWGWRRPRAIVSRAWGSPTQNVALGTPSRPRIAGRILATRPHHDQPGVGEIIAWIVARERLEDNLIGIDIVDGAQDGIPAAADRPLGDPQQEDHIVAVPGDARIEDADDFEIPPGRLNILRPDQRILRRSKNPHTQLPCSPENVRARALRYIASHRSCRSIPWQGRVVRLFS